MDTAKKAAKTVSDKAEWVWSNKKKVAAALLADRRRGCAPPQHMSWVGWLRDGSSSLAQVLGVIAGGDG